MNYCSGISFTETYWKVVFYSLTEISEVTLMSRPRLKIKKSSFSVFPLLSIPEM